MLGVYSAAGNIITKSLDAFMKNLSESLITGLQPILLTALTIYFMCKAWSLMYGRGDQQGQTMKDLSMQCIKMAFVVFFFCNAPNFYEYVTDTLWRLDGFFADMMKSSIPGASDIKNSFEAVDSVHNLIMQRAETQASYVMEAIIKDIGFSEVIHGFAFFTSLIAAMLWLELCVTLATFIGFVVLVTNTLGLAFIIAFGPLFGSFLLFPQLKQMFQSWLKTCLTFILTKVFVSGGCFMMVSMSDKVFRLLGDSTLNLIAEAKDADTAQKIASNLVVGPFSRALEINANLVVLGLILLLFGLFFLKSSAMASNVIGGMQMGAGAAEKLTTPNMSQETGLQNSVKNIAAAPFSAAGLAGKTLGAAGGAIGGAIVRAGRNVGRIIGAIRAGSGPSKGGGGSGHP